MNQDATPRSNPEVIQALYTAFSDVPKAVLEHVCHLGCCIGPGEREQLLSKPLKETDPDILWYYPSDAIWTVGSKADFKYFVPRLLELGIRPVSLPDRSGDFIAFPETFGKKLALADFGSWSEAQKSSVDDAIYIIFKRSVAQNEMMDIDGWLNAICHISISVARYLCVLDAERNARIGKAWRKMVTPDPRMLINAENTPRQRHISGAFWDELSDDQIQDVVDWVVAHDMRNAFNR